MDNTLPKFDSASKLNIYYIHDDAIRHDGHIVAIDKNGMTPEPIAWFRTHEPVNQCESCSRLLGCVTETIDCKTAPNRWAKLCPVDSYYDVSQQECVNIETGECIILLSKGEMSEITKHKLQLLIRKSLQPFVVPASQRESSEYTVSAGWAFGYQPMKSYLIKDPQRAMLGLHRAHFSKVAVGELKKGITMPMSPIIFRPFVTRVSHVFRADPDGYRTITLTAANVLSRLPAHENSTRVLLVYAITNLTFVCPRHGMYYGIFGTYPAFFNIHFDLLINLLLRPLASRL